MIEDAGFDVAQHSAQSHSIIFFHCYIWKHFWQPNSPRHCRSVLFDSQESDVCSIVLDSDIEAIEKYFWVVFGIFSLQTEHADIVNFYINSFPLFSFIYTETELQHQQKRKHRIYFWIECTSVAASDSFAKWWWCDLHESHSLLSSWQWKTTPWYQYNCLVLSLKDFILNSYHVKSFNTFRVLTDLKNNNNTVWEIACISLLFLFFFSSMIFLP